MPRVNHHLISAALAPLTVANIERPGGLDLDPDDEASIRKAFCTYVCPYVAGWAMQSKTRLRLSLAYYLDHPKVLDDILAAEQDLDLPEPADLVRFFEIVWDCIYPGEDPYAVDLTGVEEHNDWTEYNRIHDD